MKAVVQDRFGPSEVLRLDNVDLPVPDATSVLVRVRSASINGLDWRYMRGEPFIGRLFAFGLLRPKRRVRGVDLAGEVVEVKHTGSPFHVGGAVFGLGAGTFAEYAAADEKELTKKPETVSFDDASTLGVAAFTALQALRDHGHLRDGQTVAVTGASSAVGTFAIQIARSMGARVTAVTRADCVELLRSVGAEAVVDYETVDFTQGTERYDLIVDISGRNSIPSLLGALRPGGSVVIVGGRGGFGRILGAGLRHGILRQPVVGFIAKVSVPDLDALGRLVAEGKVKPVIDHVYPLADTGQAMAQAERHRARGKLVIHVA